MKPIQKLIGALTLAMSALSLADTLVKPELKLTAEQRYDNEIQAEQVYAPTLQGVSGWMTKISPQVGANAKNETLTADGWYALDFIYRPDSPDFSKDTQFNHRGALSLKQAVTQRLDLSADVKLWKVTDPTSLPRLGMARTLSPVLYGTGDAAVRYRFTRRVSGKVGYHFEGARIDDIQNGEHWGVSHSPFAELWYAVTPRDDLGVQYRYQTFSFNTFLRDGTPYSDFAQSNAVLGLYHHAFTPHLELNARAGAAFFDHPNGLSHFQDSAVFVPTPSGTVPVGSLDLEKYGEYLDLGANIGHDLVGASAFTTAVWADYASINFHWRVAKPVKAFGAASYFRNGYAANVGANPWNQPADPNLQASQGYAFELGLEWNVSRAMAVQAAYDRISQIANNTGAQATGVYQNFTRNIVAARLVVSTF